MRIIKLSREDEDMRSRAQVLDFFLRRIWEWGGRFGVTAAKMAQLSELKPGTLLVFTYETECVFIGSAASSVLASDDEKMPGYFLLDRDTLRSISCSLRRFERALRHEGLAHENLVNRRDWPRLPDDCASFARRFFDRYQAVHESFPELEASLEQELHGLYRRAGEEAGYWGKRFLGSLKRNGGLRTVRRMLRPQKAGRVDLGLSRLKEAGLAEELSVEAIVLQRRFRPLFTDLERAEAARRLAALPSSARRQRVAPEENFPETVPPDREYIEGAVKKVLVNAYERDPAARQRCLAHYGYMCQVCTFDFEAEFGELGAKFIHVHHCRPLGAIRRTYRVNPVRDLIPVCPNCHAMLHAEKPPLTVAKLRTLRRTRSRSAPLS
jgi:5-methylcytosine-specific restriction protein A